MPNLFTAGLAQQKIFQDKFAVASSKGGTANPARYFAVTGGLRSGFGSNDLIKGVAVRALKKLYPRGCLEVSPQMRAATEAAPYRHAKLTAVALSSMNGEHFAALLERAIQRSREGPKQLELKANGPVQWTGRPGASDE